MRKVLFLLLFCSLMTQLYAQLPPANDNCSTAQQIELKTPASCPATSTVVDTFTFSNIGATPTDPFPAPPSCGGPQRAAEVWYSFVPHGNSIQLQLQGDLESIHAILFEGTGCENMYPVACGSGTTSLELQAIVDPNRTYYLMISGGSIEDQGAFQLAIRTTNNCFSCELERRGHFVISPALDNGTLPGGEPVQICYVVTRWNASATGELIHALELDFGDGWDMATFSPIIPASCTPTGEWGWYENWVSSANGNQFGPGFAFDGSNFGFLDDNPGNNRGMGGPNCSNIGISAPNIEFCWTIAPKECLPEQYGHQADLSINTRLLGDGASGSWGYSACYNGTTDGFQASLYCPDPLAPTVTTTDAGCSNTCNGSITITGGGEGPWNYLVGDTSGVTLYQSFNNTGPDTIPDLCFGVYNISIYSIPAGETRYLQVTIGAGQAPQANASYVLPCIAGEPIYLYGLSTPEAGATYSWTGPNGFSSDKQNPLAVNSGTYTLVVTVDGCASLPFILEVPPIEDAVVSIAEDTISACFGEPLTITATGTATTFTWYDMATAEIVGTGPTLTVDPVDGAVYRVTGTNGFGCGGFDEVTIIVPFTPFIETDAGGIVCPGTDVMITVSDGETFSWSTGDSTANILVSPTSSSIYYVTITGSNGCIANLSATVTVSNPASLFISPDASICEGETVSLFASGGSVEWSTGDFGAPITVSPTDTTIYTATIRDNNGCQHVLTTTVSVSPAPDVSLSPSDTTTICQGQSISLQAFVADTLFWDTLVSPAQITSYSVPGAASLGCLSLGAFTVAVNPTPLVSISGDTTICGTDSLLLTATGDGDLLWSTGDTSSSIYVTPVDTALYTVTATNAFGCQAEDSITIIQADAPATPVITCQSSLSSVLFTWVIDTSLSYNIYLSNGPIGAFLGSNQYEVDGLTPGQSITITLTASNAAGCTSSATATCSAADCSILELITGVPDAICSDFGPVGLFATVTNGSASGIGSWSGPGVDTAAATFDPLVAGPGAHTLVYTYSEAGCTLDDTLSITVEQPLDASMVDCESGPSFVVFNWPVLPQDTGYTVQVLTGQTGSFAGPGAFKVDSLVAGDTVVIEITALGSQACGDVVVTASCTASLCEPVSVRADTFICLGSSVVLTTDAAGWDTFHWSGNELSCNDCASPTATPYTTTTYTLVASNNAGCSDTATVTVYVNTIPPAYLPNDPVIFCQGDEVDICLPNGDIYLWVGPNGFLDQSQCLHFDSATAENTGPYYGLLWIGGCRIYKRIELKMALPIEVNAITDFVVTCPDSIFTLAVDAEHAVSYLWSPGEYLDCPDCQETKGSIPQTATFSLTMTDAYGCTATELATVFVDDCSPQPLRSLPKSEEETSSGLERIRFYPNPASSNIQAELPVEGVKTIQLMNTSGAIVRSLRTADAFAQLSVEGLPAGSYLFRVITETGVHTGWVVVAR